MKLILTSKYYSEEERKQLANRLNQEFQEKNLDGCSYNEIKEIVEKEKEKVYVTADEKFLMLHPYLLKKEDVYLYDGKEMKGIQECTSKELREAHNLFRMYIAGAFEN